MNIMTGSLEDFGLKVSIEDYVLLPSGSTTIPANSDTMLQLHADAGDSKGFRGFLIRLSDPLGESTVGFLTIPDSAKDHAQIAAVCTDLSVAGVTQVSNELHATMEFGLNVPVTTEGLVLEVTAVILNRMVNNTWVSEYYTSHYKLTGNADEAGTVGPADGTQESTATMLTLALG